ncbi:anti-sigma B factor antagonist/stage II sporulation protein AA (anti-sigma F factor antagonist) [Evansella vedderi]|uniref:Anti-sigma factor antagonist n=1 Tax=Evansella vedderi TaxID=38282 RepID=A0ABT9ZQR0_9BACI|nr:STAS domain-containing protein [Evansella vedderi]MDQ0253062.1 anti-sigma B factor antagonist/stage II sporulation protein AA (anti-sigma F factor antagonist) [Evansella vedderi]
MFTFSKNTTGGYLNIYLKGDLDIEGTEVMEREITPEMEKYSVVNMDFTEVPFIDSSGMGLLLNLVHTLNKKGTTVYIVNVKKDVMEVFELLQIPDILGEGVFV